MPRPCSRPRSLEEALRLRARPQARAARAGPRRDGVRILPGLATFIGGTEAEARRRRRELIDLIAEHSLALAGTLASRQRLGWTAAAGSRPAGARQPHLLRPLAVADGYRARRAELAAAAGIARLVGTPEQIADDIERWFRAGAADGFNLMPDVLPGGLQDFVDGVVPILQQRGLFRGDYEGSTLREHLGLKRPGTAA